MPWGHENRHEKPHFHAQDMKIDMKMPFACPLNPKSCPIFMPSSATREKRPFTAKRTKKGRFYPTDVNCIVHYWDIRDTECNNITSQYLIIMKIFIILYFLYITCCFLVYSLSSLCILILYILIYCDGISGRRLALVYILPRSKKSRLCSLSHRFVYIYSRY